MKTKFFSRILSILMFVIGTFTGITNVHSATVPIGQSIEDVYSTTTGTLNRTHSVSGTITTVNDALQLAAGAVGVVALASASYLLFDVEGLTLGFFAGAITRNQYRAVYNVIKNAPQFKGRNVIPTLGFIRSITSMGTNAATGNKIEFQIIQNGVSTVAGERRLENSDAFFSVYHQFGIGKVATGVSANTLVDEFFPNANVFTNATELAALKTLWREGVLNITINNTIYYDTYPIANFLESIYKEKDLVLTGGQTNAYTYSSVKGDETGVRELTPYIFYSGKAATSCSVSLLDNATVAWGANGTSTNYASYTNHGFYIKGGALDGQALKDFMEYINQNNR